MNGSWQPTGRLFISRHAFSLPGFAAMLSRSMPSFAHWTIWLMRHQPAARLRIFVKNWKTGGSGLLKDMPFPLHRNRLARAYLPYWLNTAFPLLFFSTFSTGCLQTSKSQEIRDFQEMYRYCYRVAGTVGLAMTHILGVRSPQALEAAEKLGIGMQLTNILRDVGGDLAVVVSISHWKTLNALIAHLPTSFNSIEIGVGRMSVSAPSCAMKLPAHIATM